jgi:LysM repeat protein
MNNPNPFLPQGSFLEQKNKARARLKIAVFFSISLSVVVLMALLIQGCRKNDTGQPEQTSATGAPELSNTPPPETNLAGSTNLGAPPTAPMEPNNPPPVAPPVVPEPATSDYTVVKNDTFATIAKANHVSVKAIEQVNPGVDPKRLKIGQKLHIPAASSAAPMETTPNGGAAPETAVGGEQTYKVKSGDTLTGIAKQFHTSIKAIESANNLKTTSIRVGQTLKIPGKAAAPESAPAPAPEAAPPVPAPVTTPTQPPAAPTNH